jgi:hypothetical protein
MVLRLPVSNPHRGIQRPTTNYPNRQTNAIKLPKEKKHTFANNIKTPNTIPRHTVCPSHKSKNGIAKPILAKNSGSIKYRCTSAQ